NSILLFFQEYKQGENTVRKILMVVSLSSSLLFSGFALAEGTPAANPVASASNTTSNNATNQIESTVHQYLMKKPEVVVEALQAYQQKQMESMQKVFKDTQKIVPNYVDVLFHQASDPIGGNADGAITVVEFSDYQCSHCIEVSPIVNQAMKANSDLKVVIKEFPIRGPMSEKASAAGLAAYRQGGAKYWAFRDALFHAAGAAPALTESKIYEVAQTAGLDVNQLKKDMEDKSIKDAVAANVTLAKNLKLMGTPAFFVAKSSVKNGVASDLVVYIPGLVTQDQLQALIDQAKKQ
ncbi:MAG TPA: DsbA family protein, partial [Gammaproteobacteria bacterium]|nr:DsbA family protein [Gammaproteobacteria bacterium]